MTGSLSTVDYVVVAVFFAVMVGVGVYYSRRPTSSAQFFGNDKTVPWWLSGVSFYMNSFSALAFVMYSALAYKFGWIPVTISWISVPVVLLGAWLLAVRWRRAAKGSPIDFVAERYTPAMCGTLAVLGLPMQLLDNALKLLAIGTVVGVGMGFPLFWAICISGAIIVIYTFLGGLKATLACDFIQFFVIMAVVFALPILCLGRLASLDGGTGVVHGFKVFLERVPPGFFDFTAGKYTLVYMLVFFCVVCSTLSTNWSLVQRYYSTRSDGDARKMAYLVAVLLFLGPPLFFFPAMAARVFLPDLPESEMNGVYALLCREVLPIGMMGLVVAAMFAATMSSLAGNFNAAAAVMVNELYLRFSKSPSPRCPRGDGRRRVPGGRAHVRHAVRTGGGRPFQPLQQGVWGASPANCAADARRVARPPSLASRRNVRPRRGRRLRSCAVCGGRSLAVSARDDLVFPPDGGGDRRLSGARHACVPRRDGRARRGRGIFLKTGEGR